MSLEVAYRGRKPWIVVGGVELRRHVATMLTREQYAEAGENARYISVLREVEDFTPMKEAEIRAGDYYRRPPVTNKEVGS